MRQKLLCGVLLTVFVSVLPATADQNAFVASLLPEPSQTGNTSLTSGAPAYFSFEVNSPTVFFGDFGFKIQVPENATQLEVRLGGIPSNLQFAIFLRYNRDISLSGGVQSDHGGIGNQNPLVVTRQSDPPLRAGTYFIGILILAPLGPVTGTVTAIVSTAPPPPPPTTGPTLLASGVAANFSLNPATQATLFRNAYRIEAPAGVTQLQVRLLFTTPNVSGEIFVRYGEDVGLVSGQPVFDYAVRGSGGDKTLIITTSSSPPLRIGTYYIAFSVLTTGVATQGSVTATLSTAPPPPAAAAIAVSASSLNFMTPAGSNPPSQTLTVRNSGGGTLNFQISSNQPWLMPSPDRGSSTGQTVTITASINASGLGVGVYNGELRISQSTVAASVPGVEQAGPVTVAVRLEVTTVPPLIPTGGAVNAASSVRNAAAEMILSLYGSNFASSTVAADRTPLPTTLAGTSVKVTDALRVERFASLFFVSPGQINLTVPAGTAPGAATLTVTRADGASGSTPVQIDPVAPGLFTANSDGRGAPAALATRFAASGAQTQIPVFQCGAQPGSCAPVPMSPGAESDQLILLLFGTGIRGRSDPGAVRATIGGAEANVLFAGPQGTFVGLDQVNVRIPRSLLGRGEVDLVLTVDGRAANTIRVNIGGS